MARTKRKMRTRAKAHVRFVKSERKKRVNAAGATRTAKSRSNRRARRLAKKVTANRSK